MFVYNTQAVLSKAVRTKTSTVTCNYILDTIPYK